MGSARLTKARKDPDAAISTHWAKIATMGSQAMSYGQRLCCRAWLDSSTPWSQLGVVHMSLWGGVDGWTGHPSN